MDRFTTIKSRRGFVYCSVLLSLSLQGCTPGVTQGAAWTCLLPAWT